MPAPSPHNPPAERVIIHLDMDAFYASVEVRDNPALQGQPVVVGGPSGRSVVSAASYEARRYGIRSAMPVSRARQLCPAAVFLPVRMGRYREVSEQIMAIFARFTPLVEPLSLDEAFLDVTGSARLFGSGREIAVAIKRLIREETGLTGSAGVAGNKLLAKIASDLDKPDGLTVVAPGTAREFLAPLPVTRLWGVGEATLKELALLGVASMGDLAALPVELLLARFGKSGPHLHQSALGLDDREVVPEREAKSVGHEDTYEEDLRDPAQIRKELLSLAVRVGARLRRHHLEGRTVSLKVRYSDFTTVSRAVTLTEATADGQLLFRAALALLAKTEAHRRPVRLLGISVSNLVADQAPRQGHLFGADRQKARRVELNRALDRINRKFGRATLNPASLLDPDKDGAA
ncbi:MAG: DNA polymerase IV [Desulfobulbaceae bacterium]|nr:DNA polymerase IV [Desulfobulbaceae bacterium]